MICNVTVGGTSYRLTVERDREGWKCELDGRLVKFEAQLIRPDVISLICDGKTYHIRRDQLGNQTRVWIENHPYTVDLSDPRSLSSHSRKHGKTSTAKLLASMPGRVLRVLVSEMQQVESGQSLLVIEAMKMQNEIKSPNEGIVKRLISEGTYVNAGDLLAMVE